MSTALTGSRDTKMLVKESDDEKTEDATRAGRCRWDVIIRKRLIKHNNSTVSLSLSRLLSMTISLIILPPGEKQKWIQYSIP